MVAGTWTNVQSVTYFWLYMNILVVCFFSTRYTSYGPIPTINAASCINIILDDELGVQRLTQASQRKYERKEGACSITP